MPLCRSAQFDPVTNKAIFNALTNKSQLVYCHHGSGTYDVFFTDVEVCPDNPDPDHCGWPSDLNNVQVTCTWDPVIRRWEGFDGNWEVYVMCGAVDPCDIYIVALYTGDGCSGNDCGAAFYSIDNTVDYNGGTISNQNDCIGNSGGCDETGFNGTATFSWSP